MRGYDFIFKDRKSVGEHYISDEAVVQLDEDGFYGEIYRLYPYFGVRPGFSAATVSFNTQNSII